MTEFGALETLGEMVALLRTTEAKKNGLEEKVFHRNGIVSIEVAATALRARGYQVEVFETGGGTEDALALDPRRGREGATEGPSAALRPAARRPALALRGRSVRGRQLYERFMELRLRTPDWWALPAEQRDAWDALAAELSIGGRA